MPKVTSKVEFDANELTNALLEGVKEDSEGFSVQELKEFLNNDKNEFWIRSQLKFLIKFGKVVVGKKSVLCIDGTLRRVPCYRMVKK